MTAELKPNKYAETCEYCGRTVDPGKGIVLGGNRYVSFHKRCLYLIYRASSEGTEVIKGPDGVWTTPDDPIFSDKNCRNEGYIVPPRRKPGGN